MNSEGRLICNLGWLSSPPEMPRAEVERFEAEVRANGQLIVAAQDLEAALKEMIEVYGSDDGRGPIAIIERAKAAIAKAEGRQ